jgi:hypothetical protein
MRTLTVILFLMTSTLLFAQHDKMCNQGQIQAQKVAFLTNKLDLSVQEAQQFWPIYNEYEKKKDNLFKNEKDLFNAMTSNDKLTDKEMEELTGKYIDIQLTEAKLSEEYDSKFKKVLPVKKVMILYTSDRMFKKELLKQLRNCPMDKEK